MSKEREYHNVGWAIANLYKAGDDYIVKEMDMIMAIMRTLKPYQKGERRQEAYQKYNNLRDTIHEKKYGYKMSPQQTTNKLTGGSLDSVIESINKFKNDIPTKVVIKGNETVSGPSMPQKMVVSATLRALAISKLYEKNMLNIDKLSTDDLKLIAGLVG